jgi:hypothetical protein
MSVARFLLRHPRQLPTVVRAGWRLRSTRWWRHAPFLPLPDRAYWRFRMMTVMGPSGERMSGRDVVAAAKWSLRQRVGR